MSRRTARIFTTGRSQAVRLSRKFRFAGTEVFIRRDEKTGDVILSPKPQTWDDFFRLRDQTQIPDDFLNPPKPDRGAS